MHLIDPSQSYSWPLHDDDSLVQQTHVVTKINTPSLSSASARQYHVSPNGIEVIENLIQVYNQLCFCV